MPASERGGPLAAALEALDDDNVMLVSAAGIMTQVPVAGVELRPRDAPGHRIADLGAGDRVAGVTRMHGGPGTAAAAVQLDLLSPGRRP